MAIYLITRTDRCGYDETHAVVVSAPNQESAYHLAKATRGDQPASAWDTAEIEQLTPWFVDDETSTPRVILTDFMAG